MADVTRDRGTVAAAGGVDGRAGRADRSDDGGTAGAAAARSAPVPAPRPEPPVPVPRPEPGPGRLVGREHASAALQALLSRYRLVTVTGPVGVGKSALASAALAARARATGTAVVHVRVPDPYGDVRAEPLPARPAAAPGNAEGRAARALAAALLAALTRPAAPTTTAPTTTAPTTAEAGDSAPGRSPGQTPGEALGRAFDAFVAQRGGGEVVLLLDDVDPVQLSALRLVAWLLRERSGVRLVVTARRALGIGEERVVRLAPLAVEAREGGRPAPAVRLFLERAGAGADATRPESPTPDAVTLRAVTEVCALLDGLPLAVEHAVRRLGRPEPAALTALAARLRTRGLCSLGDPLAVLPRHRSLRQALAAVDALCGARDRAVWTRAGGFAGSFTEEAAVALCAGGEVGADEVPACLARLTAVGVLAPLGDPGGVRPPRLRMSRAAQDFARERLSANGEAPVVRDRLESHARRVAASAANLWDSGVQTQAVETVQEEIPNLLTALSRPPLDAEHAEDLLQTVLDLWFWWVLHDPDQGRRLLTALLAHCPEGGGTVRRSQWLAAWLGVRPVRTGAGEDPLAAAWTAALFADDRAETGRIAFVQALDAWRCGDVDAATGLLSEAVEQIPAYAPGGPSAATALAVLALVLVERAPAAARRAAWQAITWSGQQGDGWACFVARYALTLADLRGRRPARAARRARRILAARRRDLPVPLGARALARLAAALADVLPGRVLPGDASVTDARHAVPLPPPLRRPVAPLPARQAAAAGPDHRRAAQPDHGAARPGEEPGCIGGPMRTYRRK